MDDAVKFMKNECGTHQFETTLPLMYTYFRNIIENPTQEKFRKIRIENAKFNEVIWKFESCRTLLFLCGFEQNGDFIVLPAGIDVTAVNGVLQNALKNYNIPFPNKSPSKKVRTESGNALNLNPSVAGGSIFVEDLKANLTLLSYLTEMGYPKNASEKALVATKNKGVQPAMEWIEEHPECFVSTEEPKHQTIDSSSNAKMGIMDQSNNDVVTSRLHDSVNNKIKYQEKQRLEAIKKAKIEKEEEKKAKELLMKKLKSERQEANLMFQQRSAIRQEKKAANQVPSSSSTDTENPDLTHIRIKALDGTTKLWTTDKNSTVQDLFNHVENEKMNDDKDFIIVRPHPHYALSNHDMNTLADIGLFPNGTVAVRDCSSSISNENSKGDAEAKLDDNDKDENTEN